MSETADNHKEISSDNESSQEVNLEDINQPLAEQTNSAKSPFKQGNKLGLEDHYFYMAMHLSQFFAIAIPVIGIVVPFILWLMNKGHDKKVDVHGRIIFNWIFSVFIYGIFSAILASLMIGFVTLGLLILMSSISPIIGAFKARSNKLWSYPLSIQFFKVKADIYVHNNK